MVMVTDNGHEASCAGRRLFARKDNITGGAPALDVPTTVIGDTTPEISPNIRSPNVTRGDFYSIQAHA